jgi:nitrogen regulatory protein PII
MSEPFETAKVKLLTIIAPFGLGDNIAQDLQTMGVGGFTSTSAHGWGRHGSRHFGLVDGANVRIETLVSAQLAQEILERVVGAFAHDAVVAFTQDVEAGPRSRFA